MTDKSVYESKGLNLENHGKLKNFYMSDPLNLLLQFEDLSLHMIESKGQRQIGQYHLSWSREEALSQIKQLEIVKSNTEAGPNVPNYVKHMNQGTDSIDKVPLKIVERLIENVQML